MADPRSARVGSKVVNGSDLNLSELSECEYQVNLGVVDVSIYVAIIIKCIILIIS